jgi:hypothetical protein
VGVTQTGAARALEETEEIPLVAAVGVVDQRKLSPAALPLTIMHPALKTPITRNPIRNVLSLLYE